MMKYSWLCVAYPVVLYSFFVAANENGCPETSFIGCVTRIRLKRVPFDTNMLNVVFNVTTEAKLRQTCIAYSEALPCFRDRILQCGNEKQKRLLDEVVKMIKFFCSATSAPTQQTFLKHGACIGKVLQMPASNDCTTNQHRDGKKLELCRQICYERKEFLCMMRIWVSEQSLCTLMDAEKHCGQEAGEFYQRLQNNVFTDSFPIICDYTSMIYNSTAVTPQATTFAIATTTTTTTASTDIATTTTSRELVATATETLRRLATDYFLGINRPAETSTTSLKAKFNEIEFANLAKKTMTEFQTTSKYNFNHQRSSQRPMETNYNIINTTPDYQFNRIIEVTAHPPPFEFPSATESNLLTTNLPLNQIWQPDSKYWKSRVVQKPDRIVNYNYPFLVETNPITTVTRNPITTSTQKSSATQTFWRPWYLQGVGYNFDTTASADTLLPGTKTTATTTAIANVTAQTNSIISLTDLFSLETFKKLKSNKELETNSISLTGNNDIGSRKDTDMSYRTFGWPFWNGSQFVCRCSLIFVAFCLMFVSLF